MLSTLATSTGPGQCQIIPINTYVKRSGTQKKMGGQLQKPVLAPTYGEWSGVRNEAARVARSGLCLLLVIRRVMPETSAGVLTDVPIRDGRDAKSFVVEERP